MSRALPPLHEITFRTSRAGGPGGQNVNKVETRVEAIWSLEDSEALTPDQKTRLRGALARRLHEDGTIRVVSRTERTQAGNRRAAVERLQAVIAAALIPRKRRKPTVASRASSEARLQEKRRRSEIKRSRTRQGD